MKNINLYNESHLIVAAIRITEFKKKKAPCFKDISSMLGINIDKVTIICRKLEEYGVIKIIPGLFENFNIEIIDHLKIETMPQNIPQTTIADEIKKFQAKSKHDKLENKIKSAVMEKKEKDQKLFEEIQKKFKQQIK